MVLDYSKWDALELSDDSDIEVHPNVDKRSFIRAKQNQIHQDRYNRRHQIETLKYERIVNDGLLTRIDALLKALQSHQEAGVENPDEVVFQSLIESAGDPAEDQPPKRPDSVHSKTDEQPTYSKMMAALIDQVKKEIEESKPENRYNSYITGVKGHQTKVLNLQQSLLEKLAELEKIESSKITSDSIHTGFNSSHVSAAKDYTNGKAAKSPSPSSKATSTVELLNAPKRNVLPRGDSYQDSGADADVEDGMGGDEDDDEDAEAKTTALGRAFSKIPAGDYRASMQFISENPSVLAERETDGLLVEAFESQIDGKDAHSKQCVHQALLLQYCRSLGRDGVALFFKRISTPDHQARKVFFDDVNSTYARLRDRAAQIVKEREEESGDREQIQLHAVNPGQTIAIHVPSPDVAAEAQSRALFEAFPPGLQRALESGSLDEVNKVLGRMSVEQAEEVVAHLDQGGMLSMEEGIVDATTEEGRAQMEEIERTGRMPGRVYEEDDAEIGEPGNIVDEMD